MVFCAYCGKCFTRKEHLERHIPSHTNVKPHRCTACQLSFSRRDLLQRHYSTYHEAKDAANPVPGQVTMVAGRAPIACLNCANAKTGCDKRVPCARCAEKNLPCAARFARRSSKMARKIGLPNDAPMSMNNSMTIDADSPPDSARLYPSPQESTLDPRLQASPSYSPVNITLAQNQMIPSPPNGLETMEEIMQMNAELGSPTANFQDVLNWNGFGLDIDMYPNPESLAPPEITNINFSDKEDSSSALSSRKTSSRGSVSSLHTRSTSIASQLSDLRNQNQSKAQKITIPEIDVVMAADAAWPLARCNPSLFSGSCPRTALAHLESLEKSSKLEDPWLPLEHLCKAVGHGDDLLTVKPITTGTRDRLLAITQTFLHKALLVHHGGVNGSSYRSQVGTIGPNFLVLPPSKVLEYFLVTYHHSLVPYYLLTPGNLVDPNEMIDNNHASALLVLLMIAQGASKVPAPEARYLAAGLTETCRISLFDVIERDVELCADLTILRCALHFITLAAWSGDKWHMDIAQGQRGMYLAMIKHSGLLEPQLPSASSLNHAANIESQWRFWLNAEKRNRLVYDWILVDQELSLFYDTAPVLSVAEIQAPIPSSENLWKATDASQWIQVMQSSQDYNTNSFSLQPGPSLNELFRELSDDSITSKYNQLSPMQLRLLLHPLQSLVYHLKQATYCLPDTLNSRIQAKSVNHVSMHPRIQEVQTLLQKWYELCMLPTNFDPQCTTTRANLTLYHLISLEAVICFPEIERLSRKEAFDDIYWQISMRYKQCVYQQREALLHAGQVFRHIRSIPKETRPHWWSIAVYRAAMVFWVTSVSIMDPNLSKADTTGAPFAIDSTPVEHPAMVDYVWHGQGIPMLTRSDGRYASLDLPNNVLYYCVDVLEEGIPTRMSDGLERKLQTLFARWNVETLQTAA